jgi:hypothetical protein
MALLPVWSAAARPGCVQAIGWELATVGIVSVAQDRLKGCSDAGVEHD